MMSMDENAFFREATVRICSSLDIETALERCHDYIKDFFPVAGMTLHLLDFDLNIMRFLASIAPRGEKDFGKILPLPTEDREEVAERWANAEPIEIINRLDSRLRFRKFREKLGLNLDVSFMRMRLELDGSRIGALGLVADGTDQYTEDHARLLRLLHEPMAVAMANALEHEEVLKLKDMLADDNRYFQRQLLEHSGHEVIGSEFGLKPVMEMVEQVAPLDSPVLLRGETGTGKEIIAKAIHYSSSRKDGPFITVNCGAIPENLIDSELFGHEKGAFTGAVSQKRGRFERADKGTIFLDEIGELMPQAQVRLLHVLQNREIERVGGTRSIPVDIRIISATHRDLEEMTASGQFREDLWFRLNVFPIAIPPLRHRKADIPALVHHLLERKAVELKISDRPKISPGAMDRLTAYDWPGNVRELENLVERALIRCRGGVLSFDGLIGPVTIDAGQGGSEAAADRTLVPLDEMNARYIQRAVTLAKGKISGPSGAAELLKVHPNTLRKRMNKLGVAYGKKKLATG